jgi:hypothetical protein
MGKIEDARARREEVLAARTNASVGREAQMKGGATEKCLLPWRSVKESSKRWRRCCRRFRAGGICRRVGADWKTGGEDE